MNYMCYIYKTKTNSMFQSNDVGLGEVNVGAVANANPVAMAEAATAPTDTAHLTAITVLAMAVMSEISSTSNKARMAPLDAAVAASVLVSEFGVIELEDR